MNSRSEIPGTTIFGRPFKPLAIGLIIGSSVLGLDFLINFVRTPVLQHQTPISGFLALLAVSGMIIAWIIRSQRLYEVGLLFIMGLWVARSVELTLLVNVFDGLLPFSIAFSAGGAYWLEKISDNRRMG